jgi:hypothetical protein
MQRSPSNVSAWIIKLPTRNSQSAVVEMPQEVDSDRPLPGEYILSRTLHRQPGVRLIKVIGVARKDAMGHHNNRPDCLGIDTNLQLILVQLWSNLLIPLLVEECSQCLLIEGCHESTISPEAS